jgi:hypothetical protein
MKILETNQLVGLGFGMSVLRDLYETENGKRVSIRKTKVRVANSAAERKNNPWVFLTDAEIYRERVEALENEGLTTSDAQAVVDMETQAERGAA